MNPSWVVIVFPVTCFIWETCLVLRDYSNLIFDLWKVREQRKPFYFVIFSLPLKVTKSAELAVDSKANNQQLANVGNQLLVCCCCCCCRPSCLPSLPRCANHLTTRTLTLTRAHTHATNLLTHWAYISRWDGARHRQQQLLPHRRERERKRERKRERNQQSGVFPSPLFFKLTQRILHKKLDFASKLEYLNLFFPLQEHFPQVLRST